MRIRTERDTDRMSDNRWKYTNRKTERDIER